MSENGLQYLAIDVAANRVWLASSSMTTRLDRPLIVLDVEQAARGFARVAGPMPLMGFNIFQTSQMAGTSVHVLRRWISSGIVVLKRPGRVGRDGSARFDKIEAFAVAALGALVRAKVPYSILKRVYRLLSTSVPTTTERGAVEQAEASTTQSE